MPCYDQQTNHHTIPMVPTLEATLAMKLELELSPGAMIWSLDPLPLQGVKVQETLDGKTSLVPAGGLVFLRRLHLNSSWSNDVPCHIYIRVPGPSPSLRPKWPLNKTEAKRLLEASTEELVALGGHTTHWGCSL